MRKEADFLVMDRINVGVKCSDRINAVIKEESDFIKKEVLCDNISDSIKGYEKEWNINDENVIISVEKVQ